MARSRSLIVALVVALAVPASAAAGAGGPSFRAVKWVVTVQGANGASNVSVKPGGHIALCNMDRLVELAIHYRFAHTRAGHATAYRFAIAGPAGHQKVAFGTAHANGTGTSGFQGAALPGFKNPPDPGLYSVTITSSNGHRLMRALITIHDTNTCS